MFSIMKTDALSKLYIWFWCLVWPRCTEDKVAAVVSLCNLSNKFVFWCLRASIVTLDHQSGFIGFLINGFQITFVGSNFSFVEICWFTLKFMIHYKHFIDKTTTQVKEKMVNRLIDIDMNCYPFQIKIHTRVIMFHFVLLL